MISTTHLFTADLKILINQKQIEPRKK